MALRSGKKKAAKKKGAPPARKKAAPRKQPARDDVRERLARLEALVEELRRRMDEGPERDPGDAVPPGVAVQNPEPPDEEARAAQEALDEHLGSGERE